MPGARDDRLGGEVVFIDSSSGAPRVVETPDWRAVTHVAWLPDGSGLLVNAQESTGESAASQIWLLPFPDGKARQVTNDLGTYSGLSVADNGHTFVSVRNELRARIYVVPDGDVTRAQAITAGAGTDDGVQGLAWTPDDRLVYTSSSGGDNDIWIMNADGSNRAQLTTSRGNDHWPSVTPDGQVVVFVSERDGGRGLWRMDIEGGRQQRLVPAHVGQRPQLSADGKDVYYGDTAARQSFRVSIDGGTPTPLPLVLAGASGAAASLPDGFHEAAPSPDGKLISGHYNDAAQRGERMTVITPGHPEATLLLPTVPVPAQWSPDGRSLLYIDTRRGISNLWRHPVAGGTAAQITKFTNDRIFRYALSRDQKRWAIVRGDVSRDVVLVSERK